MIRRATILLAACLGLLAGAPRTGFASGLAGGPIDLLEVLNLQEQLFVGVVESNPEVEYVPSGSCADGLTGGRMGELVVRVTEVLHGAGIRPVEHVREFPSLRVPAGTRVLVAAQRTCAWDWGLWGNAYYVGEDDTLRNAPPARSLQDSTEVWVRSTDRYPDFLRDQGRRPTLTEVRTRPRGVNDRNPSRPFEEIRTLHTVRVTGTTRVSERTVEFACESLAQVLGPTSPGPTRLRFEFPPGAGNRFVGAGDTLVVPGDSANSGERRTYAYGWDFFVAQAGFLPGLGVPLARVGDVFEPVGPRIRLRRLLPAAAGP